MTHPIYQKTLCSLLTKYIQNLMASHHLHASIHLLMPGSLQELSNWPPCLYPCPHCTCLQCGIRQDHSKAKCNHVTPLLKPCDASIYHSVKVHIFIMSETSEYHYSHSCDFSTSSPSTLPHFLSAPYIVSPRLVEQALSTLGHLTGYSLSTRTLFP